MEKQKNNTKKTVNNKEKIKKINLKLENNNPDEESVIDVYNKYRLLSIITTIVVIVVYIISFVMSFGGTGAMVSTQVEPLMTQIKNMLAFSVVVILAGLVPYFFISFGGIAEVIALMGDFGTRYNYGISSPISLFIGGLIASIGIAICISTGFYLCYLTTKKRKYYNASDFGMDDVKMQLYQIRKNEEKIKEMENKKLKKAKEAEKNNIKIPYLKLSVIGAVGFIFQIIGLLISKI